MRDMPMQRCQFCTAQPLQEVAIARWTTDPDDVERDTVWFCGKHLQRVKKAGNRGFEHKGVHYKIGFW
jgi:hypothetical protein